MTRTVTKYPGSLPTNLTSIKHQTKENTTRWQRFLNWYFDKKVVEVDGAFGPETRKWTVAFQRRVFTDAREFDGEVGPKTIRKAKNIAKSVEVATKSYPGPYPDLNNLSGDIIASTAKSLAWPYGTDRKKYSYPNGKPVAKFKSAIDKAYPNHKKWGAQTGAGASCDVFTGTVIRTSGYDTTFPRGLDEDEKYLPKHKGLWKKIKPSKASELKPGDVIFYIKKKGGGHICIYVGNGKVCEAGYKSKRYGCTVKLSSSYYNSKYISNTFAHFGVYRSCGSVRKYLKPDDISTQVVYLQRYLNWCLGMELTADGVFGKATTAAVKQFQVKYGLKVDGIFGEECLKKAKTVKK